METDNLSILVIDNEQQSLQCIVDLLQLNPAVFEIISASDSNAAILKIIGSRPDVILIDYPMQGNAEKELFELIKTRLPDSYIAFVSDSKAFAQTAIRNGVYNYLLKPVKERKIKALIDSALEKKQSNIKNRLDQIMNNNSNEARLRFLTVNGYVIFSPDELIFCKSTGYTSELYLTNNRKEFSQLSLLKFEEKLSSHGFLRISRTHLINPLYLKRIFRKGSIVTLSSDGVEFELKASKAQIKDLGTLDTD